MSFDHLKKPSRSTRRLAQRDTRTARVAAEQAEKRRVRRRERHRCRFPLCGCGRLQWPLEVSHQQHKGQGGNPAGDRSTREGMILICRHRHQEGAISRHRGTLRIEALTPAGTDGPVAFVVDADLLWPVERPHLAHWFEVAREATPGVLEPLTAEQRAVLEVLATMTL